MPDLITVCRPGARISIAPTLILVRPQVRPSQSFPNATHKKTTLNNDGECYYIPIKNTCFSLTVFDRLMHDLAASSSSW